MYNGGRVTDLSGTTSWAKRSGTRFNSRTVLRSENPIGAYNGHRRQMSISQFPGWKFARICKPAVRINCRAIQRVSIDGARGTDVTSTTGSDGRRKGGGNRWTEERTKSAVKRFLLLCVVILRWLFHAWKFWFWKFLFQAHSFVRQLII